MDFLVLILNDFARILVFGVLISTGGGVFSSESGVDSGVGIFLECDVVRTPLWSPGT